MYSRNVAGKERSFGVSGKLWNGVLVMYDRESDSFWTQIDGRSIRGDALGQKLEYVESTFTTWERWRGAYPNTLVLTRDPDAEPIEASRYDEYLSDPKRLFLPELSEGLGGVAPKDLVFGVVIGEEAWAVTESVLSASGGVVHAFVSGQPVAIVRDPATQAVRAVEARRDGELLLLAWTAAGALVDAESGRPLRLDDLAHYRVDRAFWYAWSRSHPGSRVLAD